jgi:Domain of unknown function (DUF4112)
VDDTNERLRRLRALARLLDSAYEIPGTKWRFGIDALIGLVPAVGDLITTAIAVWVLKEAKTLGVRRRTRARMAWNVVIDFVGGAVPLVGDVFDVAWKANLKNLELIERDLERQGRTTRAPTDRPMVIDVTPRS